jgi:sugar/nucleoside kinase (ribokinase family)
LSPPEPGTGADAAPAGAAAGPGAGDLDLLVIGDCNPDVMVVGGDVAPAFGQQEKLVDGISLEIGGSASITAVAAARLGLRVALAAAVGDDAAGRFMLAQLAAEGVDTGAVAVRRRASTGMTVALSAGGDRAILTATGALSTLTAQDVPSALLARARHVHVSSYFLLADSLGPGLAALLQSARGAGASTSLDTNWDPAQRWADQRLTDAFAHTSLLLPNEAEALRLAAALDLDQAVATLTGAGPALAVKLGERGALCADGARRHLAQPPPVTVTDTTGAGDCFNAGVIAGLLDGLDLPASVALGCAVGAASTRAPGGTAGCPDLPTARALAQDVTVRDISPLPPPN